MQECVLFLQLTRTKARVCVSEGETGGREGASCFPGCKRTRCRRYLCRSVSVHVD